MKQLNEEKRLIEMINGMFIQSKQRITKCFESDSEVLSFGDKQLLFTIDEFSKEDMFREHDPYVLGWNVAAGGLSDISACAGKPLFYGHAMVVSKAWNTDFMKKFSQGIADVLKKTDTVFMGGDFGVSQDWHYTAAVIGSPSKKLLTRKGADAGDRIYLSGKIGIGNLEAALKLYSDDKGVNAVSNMLNLRFHLRHKEASFIGDYATSCMDTSDGVFNALNTIAETNAVGFELIRDLPYIDIGSLAALLTKLPKELLLLGEAGEYELLFTIKQENEEVFLKKAEQEGYVFYKIGKITRASKILVGQERIINLDRLPARARDFDDPKEYLEYLINYVRESK